MTGFMLGLFPFAILRNKLYCFIFLNSSLNACRILDLLESSEETAHDLNFFSRSIEPQLFESAASKTSIYFPLPDDGHLNEQVMVSLSPVPFS